MLKAVSYREKEGKEINSGKSIINLVIKIIIKDISSNK